MHFNMTNEVISIVNFKIKCNKNTSFGYALFIK